jgi:hypothetical protein
MSAGTNAIGLGALSSDWPGDVRPNRQRLDDARRQTAAAHHAAQRAQKERDVAHRTDGRRPRNAEHRREPLVHALHFANERKVRRTKLLRRPCGVGVDPQRRSVFPRHFVDKIEKLHRRQRHAELPERPFEAGTIEQDVRTCIEAMAIDLHRSGKAAGFRTRFEDRHAMAGIGEANGSSQTSDTGADDDDFHAR